MRLHLIALAAAMGLAGVACQTVPTNVGLSLSGTTLTGTVAGITITTQIPAQAAMYLGIAEALDPSLPTSGSFVVPAALVRIVAVDPAPTASPNPIIRCHLAVKQKMIYCENTVTHKGAHFAISTASPAPAGK